MLLCQVFFKVICIWRNLLCQFLPSALGLVRRAAFHRHAPTHMFVSWGATGQHRSGHSWRSTTLEVGLLFQHEKESNTDSYCNVDVP